MSGAAGARRLPRTKLSHQQSAPGILQAALHGLCPRCGAQTVFDGPVIFHLTCSACACDFARREGGGRFAAIITFLCAALLTALAMLVDEIADPPLWLQALIWAPLTMAGVIFGVRFAKAALLALRFAKAQQEG